MGCAQNRQFARELGILWNKLSRFPDERTVVFERISRLGDRGSGFVWKIGVQIK